jgi:hypothetical protein
MVKKTKTVFSSSFSFLKVALGSPPPEGWGDTK